jgi:hypothetical protein
MSINKVEAIVDAISRLNGIGNPETDCYHLRNPLLIRSFARPGKHETDEKGRRVFTSLLSGYKAALYDCELKLSGNSRAGLKPEDTLTNLLGVYGIKEPGGISNIVSFLRRALNDQNISKDTPLTYFHGVVSEKF